MVSVGSVQIGWQKIPGVANRPASFTRSLLLAGKVCHIGQERSATLVWHRGEQRTLVLRQLAQHCPDCDGTTRRLPKIEWPSRDGEQAVDRGTARHQVSLEPPRWIAAAVIFEEWKSIPDSGREQNCNRGDHRCETNACLHVFLPHSHPGVPAGTSPMRICAQGRRRLPRSCKAMSETPASGRR